MKYTVLSGAVKYTVSFRMIAIPLSLLSPIDKPGSGLYSMEYLLPSLLIVGHDMVYSTPSIKLPSFHANTLTNLNILYKKKIQ